MKKLIVFFSFLVVFSSCSENDAPNPTSEFKGELVWNKSFGGSQEEMVNSIVKTPDGGFLVLGYTDSNDFDVIKSHALKDVWLSKIDANGELIWTKTIGGSDDDFGYSIIASSDGNFVIAGYSGSSDGDVPSNLGFHDFYVTKITGNGQIIWKKSYGFNSHDHAHKIIQTKDGGYFFAGFADYAGIEGSGGTGNNGNGHNMGKSISTQKHGVGEYIGIKIDASGNFKWYRYFGGTNNDRVNDVIETESGELMLVGFSESTNFDVTDNKGSYDYWIVKLHHDGELMWTKSYGGSDIDQAFGVAATGNGKYIITGRSNSLDGDITNPKGNFDAWVIQINEEGDLLWQKSLGGSDYDSSNAIKKLKNGNFGIVGNSRSSNSSLNNKGENDFWYVVIDGKSSTGTLFEKNFGGSNIDIATDFVETSNQEIILVGESQSDNQDVLNNKGKTDLFILKMK